MSKSELNPYGSLIQKFYDDLRVHKGIPTSEDLRNKNFLVIGSNNVFNNYFSYFEELPKFLGFYSKTSGEPNSDNVNNTYLRIQSEIKSPIELIVACGGGSSIDFAKSVAILLSTGNKDITDFEFGEIAIKNTIQIIAIPTTCGSGSETTPYTVINNSETGRKFTLTCNELIPVKAFLDAKLLKSNSNQTITDTSIDALTHFLEAGMNLQNGTKVFEICKYGAIIIANDLPNFIKTKSENSLFNLLEAAMIAGHCIFLSRTGLIHTLNVAVAKYTELSHGYLNGLIMPHVLNENLSLYKGRLADFFNEDNDKLASSKITKFIRKFIPESKKIHIPSEEYSNIFARLKQDLGLSDVNGQEISQDTFINLIQNISYEKR